MAYTRHEWECGEVVTAEMLNNIEEGIEQALAGGGGSVAPLILQVETDETDPENPVYYIDTQYSEIKAAYLSGRAVILDPVLVGKSYLSIIGLYDFNPGGQVVFYNATDNGIDIYTADMDASYPRLTSNL